LVAYWAVPILCISRDAPPAVCVPFADDAMA